MYKFQFLSWLLPSDPYTPEPQIDSLQNMPPDKLTALSLDLLPIPTASQRFWRLLLRKLLGPAWLSRTCYAVFGLGDSGYPKFNVSAPTLSSHPLPCSHPPPSNQVVAKKLDRRLLDLGARPLMPRGLGDEQHPSGYEAVLDPWLDALWRQLEELVRVTHPHALPPLRDGHRGDLDPPRFRVSYVTAAELGGAVRVMDEETARGSGADVSKEEGDVSEEGYGRYRPFMAEVVGVEESGIKGGTRKADVAWGGGGQVCNERLTAVDHDQDVRHIRMALHGSVSEGLGLELTGDADLGEGGWGQGRGCSTPRETFCTRGRSKTPPCWQPSTSAATWIRKQQCR